MARMSWDALASTRLLVLVGTALAPGCAGPPRTEAERLRAGAGPSAGLVASAPVRGVEPGPVRSPTAPPQARIDLGGLSPAEARRRALDEEARKPLVRVAGAWGGLSLADLERRVGEPSSDPEVRLELAKRLHLRGVDGDDGAAARAERMLADLCREADAPPIALAYFGSARTLAAKRSWAFWRKGELAEEGIGLMDQAVAAAPRDLEVRFVRAVSCHALPFFFGRSDQAAEDFALVAASARAAVDAGAIDPVIAAGALFYDGVILSDRGAHDLAAMRWAEAVALGPDTPHGRAAKDRLSAGR